MPYGDVLMSVLQGQWSKENLPNCTDEELNQYAAILKLETPDVLKRLFGQLPLNDVRNASFAIPPNIALARSSINKILCHATKSRSETSQEYKNFTLLHRMKAYVDEKRPEFAKLQQTRHNQ